ncbi:Redoxin domain-containing protein [Janibacter hoylei PVAS-1]|uniref:Redoxin domain-containing protein n=2 Tax=Janibacter TaxID=53457 RepID=K1DUM5_9MICO|nr:Redoxin domain-containing protein [Janibacter hoylei PVAS-1]
MAVAGCSSSSDTADAAQDAGYRSGDGTLHLIPAAERDEPVELAGETIQGATWDSADERGEVVVVNLWASWCGPCAKEAPHLVEAHEETKGGGRRLCRYQLPRVLQGDRAGAGGGVGLRLAFRLRQVRPERDRHAGQDDHPALDRGPRP